MYRDTYSEYEGYGDQDYLSESEFAEYEEGSLCVPTIIETVTEQDEKTGEFKETNIYNCSNCSNCDCPYFYDMDGNF